MLKRYYFLGLFFIFLKGIYAQNFYTYIPDNNFEMYLIQSGYDNYPDHQVITMNVYYVKSVNIAAMSISNLTGIEAFVNLESLHCEGNYLTNLDLNKNTILAYLDCSQNQLSNLDLSQNSHLESLRCFDNKLESLNVKNETNSKITTFYTTGNPSLQCIQVDNESDANAGIGNYIDWHKDDTASYSEDCSTFLGIEDEILAEGLIMYPNPVTNTLTFKSKRPLERIEIYSLLGQKVKEVKSDFNHISTDNLSKGFYIIRIYSEKGYTVRKLIKQ